MIWECKICNLRTDSLREFSKHINYFHKLKSEDYTVKYIYGGNQPTCKVCINTTRYTKYSYREYCKEHSKIAMSAGGKKGGESEAWNKGKTKNNDERLLEYSKNVSGEKNHFFGKTHTKDTRKKISENKALSFDVVSERIDSMSCYYDLITSIEKYSKRQGQYFEYVCKKCKNVQRKTLELIERGSMCSICFPKGKSKWELDVFNFVSELSQDAISGDRKVLYPKEVDIYVPSKNFAIECHGLYWHSELFKKNKFVHYEKFDLAQSSQISMLQLFEDEWLNKKEICQSLIRNRMKLNERKIRPSKTKVVTLTKEEEKEFFNSTHISGYVPSRVCLGLREKSGDIIAAISLRIPRHGKKYKDTIEIARYSTASNTSIPGSLSKLVKYAKAYCKENNFNCIMTYVDRRIGSGNGYVKAGFKIVGDTGIDYWYTDCRNRFDRFKFRAQQGKSEKQVAEENSVFKIYGCGSLILKLEL